MAQDTKSAPSSDRMKFQVDGMDCPSCAGKIEKVLGRVPGLQNIQVNYAASSLTLDADSSTERLDVIIGKLANLGFTGKLLDTADSRPSNRPSGVSSGTHDHDLELGDASKPAASVKPAKGHDHAMDEEKHWWQSKKGKIVIAELVLLAAAAVVAWVQPDYTDAAFMIAAGLGLLPFLRQAVKLAISGGRGHWCSFHWGGRRGRCRYIPVLGRRVA
ncbi:MAG: cation transporter [Afipia sp.]|nr:cation transporter [Afipia sp.]